MLPTRHQKLLLMQVAAFLLLYTASFINGTPTTTRATIAINAATSKLHENSATTTAAVIVTPVTAAITAPAAVAPVTTVDVDGEIIGAKSLAAAAAAADAAFAATSTEIKSIADTKISIASTSSNNNNNNSSSEKSIPSTEFTANSANLLLQHLQHATTNGRIVNLTRHYGGDSFFASGVTSCNLDTCVGLSSGTAGLLHIGDNQNGNPGSATGSLAGGNTEQLELLTRHSKPITDAATTNADTDNDEETCQCRCLPHLNTYREDLGICVDDIHECTLSPFVSGSSSEKIPFVFLPLRGQIIYPSREIRFRDIKTPVCAVTSAQYLSKNGWMELRNPVDTDYPFRMFRDEGRAFLQWLGETHLRRKMQGRLILVHLVCRDMAISLASVARREHFTPPKNVFTPCVAFRVNGTPTKFVHNASELLFQSNDATATLAATSDGMTTREYVVIGVCSLLLGLIYISSVFVYLHIRKRKSRDQHRNIRNSLDDLANEINYPKNDQVTFGVPFNRAGSIYSSRSLANSNEARSRASICSLKEEMGIVKNNPLLQQFPQLSEQHSGFASDISNSNSECEMDAGSSFRDKLKQSLFAQLQTAALVHPQGHGGNNGSGNSASNDGMQKHTNGSNDEINESSSSPTQEQECLPVENVSIVEDMMTEEKLESLRAMVNGNVRKKLYFNPAYFEPHLLAQPPPAAIEFLQKIREVIAIAKYKMATKRYQPSLLMIPEEAPLSVSTPSMYGSQLQASSECQGCVEHRCTGHVRNCGDKRNSIEQWLQTVPTTDSQQNSNADTFTALEAALKPFLNGKSFGFKLKADNDFEPRHKQSPQAVKSGVKPSDQRISPPVHVKPEQRNSPPRKELTPPKQRPPPPPAKPASKTQTTNADSNSSVIQINSTERENQTKSNQFLDFPPHFCAKGAASSEITVSINRNYDSVSALTAAANIYGFAETGSEIYNNPKFVLNDSPSASQRSRISTSSHRSKSSRKRLDALDHYAAATTPTSLTSADRQHYEMLRSMKQIAHMNVDSLMREYNTATINSNGSSHVDIPTPDYDSTIEKKIKDVYSNTQSSAPSVPTPDYSTLSRKSLKQGQPPDSPIYRRKSPQYLIVDYETDSLERMQPTKRKSSNSSSSPLSESSSQVSPSLSTALPLEEELEINHSVYDQMDYKSGGSELKKRVAKKTGLSSRKQKEMEARIKYDTPFRGSMTIEVAHEPGTDIEPSTDTDHCENDTLDRKPKQTFYEAKTWTDMKNAQPTQSTEEVRYQQFNAMSNLPDMRQEPISLPIVHQSPNQFRQQKSNSFRSQGSYKSEHKNPIYESCVEMRAQATIQLDDDTRLSVDQLRNIYETPFVRQNSQTSCKCGGQIEDEQDGMDSLSEQGRLLTLEAKQRRRQRALEPQAPPPVMEVMQESDNKTTIKISTPKVSRAYWQFNYSTKSESGALESRKRNIIYSSQRSLSLEKRKNSESKSEHSHDHHKESHNTSRQDSKREMLCKTAPPSLLQKKRSPPPPPPPPPPNTSASTTLTSQKSTASSRHSHHHHHHHPHPHPHQHQHQHHQHHHYHHHYQNQSRCTATEEETVSNHSESTEFTRVSDTVGNSEFEGSCNNTLSSVTQQPVEQSKKCGNENSEYIIASRNSSVSSKMQALKKFGSPAQLNKKLQSDSESEYGALFNTHINGLRADYSLNKYLNRRKSNELEDEECNSNCNENENDNETTNNTNNNESNSSQLPKTIDQIEQNKVEIGSISSRSNRSSTRLSDRTKELYRNAGVPVGIAYPQRNATAGNNNAPPPPPPSVTTTVQTVYRCEIEPVQLTHGMQIAMGLKDRAKKAKDLKNAWKKFVSMAAAKFSPTQSPAPPFEKKSLSILEALDRDEGISSMIDGGEPQGSNNNQNNNNNSAQTSQNYYEQRFGVRPQEMDSGYMSADSNEVYKRSFYDRYNFKKLSGRERIIRVDTIEDNSDGGSTLTDRHNGIAASARRGNILDSNRFEDIEFMGEAPPVAAPTHPTTVTVNRQHSVSDAESDKTLTRSNGRRTGGARRNRREKLHEYSSDDEQSQSPSCGSSETDGETNVEDMWESGAESIETHSVLYKNVRNA